MDPAHLCLVDAAALHERGVDQQVNDQIPPEDDARQRMQPPQQEVVLPSERRDGHIRCCRRGRSRGRGHANPSFRGLPIIGASGGLCRGGATGRRPRLDASGAEPYTPGMRKTVVINAVGLTPQLIGEHTPVLKAFRDKGASAVIGPVLPAVTTTVQSTYLTGTWPAEHGIVGNGWYFRDECEVKFWRQSNKLVQRPKVWDHARQLDPSFTCANLFWWYAMYSTADYSVTPRPMYPADGRKLPDVWTHPAELRESLQKRAGAVPAVQVLGAGDVDRSDEVDRRGRRCGWTSGSTRRSR